VSFGTPLGVRLCHQRQAVVEVTSRRILTHKSHEKSTHTHKGMGRDGHSEVTTAGCQRRRPCALE
jgi:hypothetical protein